MSEEPSRSADPLVTFQRCLAAFHWACFQSSRMFQRSCWWTKWSRMSSHHTGLLEIAGDPCCWEDKALFNASPPVRHSPSHFLPALLCVRGLSCIPRVRLLSSNSVTTSLPERPAPSDVCWCTSWRCLRAGGGAGSGCGCFCAAGRRRKKRNFYF